jgi:hypothetical protein
MTLYLHVEAVGFSTLVSAGQALEIWLADRPAAEERLVWRGSELPIYDLPILFAFCNGASADDEGHRIYVAFADRQAEGAVAVLGFGRLFGMVELDQRDFIPAPPLSRAFNELFDAVARRPINRHFALRWRTMPSFDGLLAAALEEQA